LDDCESYEKIYKIKKRNFSKPLAIMVENFQWLENNTDLNGDQIDFLKKYNKPFTILTDSDYVKTWINFEDEDVNFINKDQYKQIAFRVANNSIQKKLVKKVGPIFLTSANISDNPEIYKVEDLKKEF
jgi:tRNA A37 threonylcarbamoyladenosine synthetase subunit TsaC/SUA5/YrdC